MNLRRQLLLVSLLLLSLPWAGCQFVREMEGALRQGQEQSLQASARSIAAVLGAQPELIYPFPGRQDEPDQQKLSIFAIPLEETLILDGYGDGWEDIPSIRLEASSGSKTLAVQYQAVTRNGYVYLLLRVEDDEVVYHNPGLSPEPNGDRLILRTWQDQRRQDYVIATAAPGRVQARAASRRQPRAAPQRIRGYWQDAVGGYTLELEIPLSYTGGRLGFYLANRSKRAGDQLETLGNVQALDTVAPPWLIYTPTNLQESLAPFANQGSHIQVLDKDRWLMADLPAARKSEADQNSTFWLLQVIYRWILSRDPLPVPTDSAQTGKHASEESKQALQGFNAVKRYRDPDYRSRTLLSTAVPIYGDNKVIGAIVLRQSGEEYLSLTDQAFAKLLGYSVLAVGLGAFGLLAYASWLSWRIGRLSRAANRALEDGQLRLDDFPRSKAPDEIGELSRNYANLLHRLREYNDYLRTLSRKLSHELRTPVAVIQTSLDNLEHTDGDMGEQNTYLNRAREGLQRLNRILTAMSEANRLEESIRNHQTNAVDLVPLLTQLLPAYQSIYPLVNIELELDAAVARTLGVADLLAQALDKLMENAASFTPGGERIKLRLKRAGAHWSIQLQNTGPVLPPDMQDHLFEPMVSVRSQGSEDMHLGLGLHITRLIVEFHRGRISASNLPDGSGVRFIVELPVIDTDS